MKPATFLFIGIFLLFLAFFHEPLYVMFPEVFEPVIKFTHNVGTEILYLLGTTALIIALFSWLPTWVSLSVFVTLMFLTGYYLSDKEISITVASKNNMTIVRF